MCLQGEQRYDGIPSSNDEGGIRRWGGVHTFRVDGSGSDTISCTFLRSDDPLAKLGEFNLKIADLILASEPVCRYTWLTIRQPKPRIQISVNVNKKEDSFGDTAHFEGVLTVKILRATGLDIKTGRLGNRDMVRDHLFSLRICMIGFALLRDWPLHFFVPRPRTGH